jgi:hypothetical protein
MGQYTKDLDKMQMIDAIRCADKSSEAGSILKLTEEIMNTTARFSSFPSPCTFAISQSINNICSNADDRRRLPIIDIILSFDKVIQTLIERIDCCKIEILIATRICPEMVINKLLEKSKLGVKVKILADIDLVKKYFRSQQKFVEEKNPINERKWVVANPWYPDTTINRRIADIPFGVIIFDNNEVGIELVNSGNPNGFYGGIFIRDKKVAMTMTQFYQQLWEKAYKEIDVMK